MNTSTTPAPTTSSSDPFTIIEVADGKRFSLSTLKSLLVDMPLLLFFAKLYDVSYLNLNRLILAVFDTPLNQTLFGQEHVHSTDLQDYLVSVIPPAEQQNLVFAQTSPVPDAQTLAHLFEAAELEIVDSIKAVAEKLHRVVDHMPGKQGTMMFGSMMKMNARRPVIGDYKAKIHHPPHLPNLVVLDVSGSMTEETVRTIVDDVIALSYKADAAFAIVSNHTFWWGPGMFDSEMILNFAEFGGTHYETLADLMDQQWGVVVTVADYDSSMSAKKVIKDCRGSIELLLDISLVGQPTYLAEVLGQLASEVRPLVVASRDLV